MLRIETLTVTPFQQNCRVLWCSETRAATVVDPGGQVAAITGAIKELSLKLTEIWLTHSHLDHCGGVRAIKGGTGARLLAHPAEEFFRCNVLGSCGMFGLPPEDMEDCPEPDVALYGGERIKLGALEFEVIATPGHSPGGLCFFCPEAKVVLVGDVLFSGSIGRTDLPGGDMATLMRSIKVLVDTLPGDTKVLSGHGPDTTLEAERETNPFLGGLQQ